MKENNKEVKQDAFGHVRLDEINPGQWFAKIFSKGINCEKVLIQKSGYFARSAKPNKKDLEIIFQSADMAVSCALSGQSGVIGFDEEQENQLQCIAFKRIKGGKPFNVKVDWFQTMLYEIGQI
jgi:pyrophosphate--fructose-6-phosphate 1-phosphotransferase